VNEKTDIVVVGGGPCGSYSAYTAAKSGVKVVVCEEHEEIGVPDHCAGHLNISSIKKLGLQIPKNAIENEIKGAIFHSPKGNKFVLKYNEPVTFVINREMFDKHLAELAEKTGVEYRFKSKVKSLLFNSNYVNGVLLKENEKIKTKIVIDAEGCSSAILKDTKLNRLKPSMTVRGIQAQVDNLEDINEEMVEVYLGKDHAPDFYAWIIPRKDGSGKIGLATSKGNPNEYLKLFMNKHPIASKKLRNCRIIKIHAHPIPVMGPIPKTYSNGFLVVGDSASQVKPTTGGGVIFGLTCAKIAGDVATDSIKNNNFSEQFLSIYQKKWKRLLGFDLSAMFKIRRILNRVPDKKIDEIISLCSKFKINELLEKFGDLDFQGRSIIPMMKYPGTISILFYLLYSYLISFKNDF
jgi:digeranylgeranylglycerophospholipid reductase